MENTSLIERLYGFLDDYDLIQAELNEEEIKEIIEATLNNLDENEEVLTCFVASDNGEYNSVYAITNKSRILGRNNENFNSAIEISEIKRIENGVEEESTKLFITTNERKHALHALNENGVDNINDALYSAINELLPVEAVAEIFDEELEEPEENISEEESPVEEIAEAPEEIETTETEVLETESPETEKLEEEVPETGEVEATEEIEEAQEEPAIYSEENIENEPQETLEGVESETSKDEDLLNKNFDEESFGSEAAVKTPGKQLNFNKPLLYVLGAIGVIIIGVIIYSAVSYITETNNANSAASTLIDYFNQVDEIYDTAVGYNKDPNAIKPEQWKELDNKARDLETKINEVDSNEKTKNLSDAVYYYDEALITSLIYGQNFSASKNPYDQNSLTRNLQQANLNRSAALGIINQDFPKFAENVKNNEDTAESLSPDQQKLDKLIEEAESHPSEGAKNRENSGNSK